MSGAGRSKKDLSGQSRDEAGGRVIRNVSARELVWVWVLILGLLSTSSVPLDTGLSPSESWFATQSMKINMSIFSLLVSNQTYFSVFV